MTAGIQPVSQYVSDPEGEFSACLGDEHVHTGAAARHVYSRDRLPRATFRLRSGHLPYGLAAGVLCPGSHEDVVACIRVARRAGVALVPVGAGSGVLGGAIPLRNEWMLDLKRLNQVIGINTEDLTVTVQAGMNGGQFERYLTERGLTCGHYPQSIHMSTVGGWAACRGAGQSSSRYGKIEDMVLGLRAVLPDGTTLEVRPVPRRAVGPSLKDVLIGSEGTLGVITEVTMRILRLPEHESPLVLAFPSLAAALAGVREVMQAEIRPSVVRLYDEEESRQRTDGLAEFKTRPLLCLMQFSGAKRLVEAERSLALELATAQDGVQASDTPLLRWKESRFQSYSPPWQARGYFMDTVEVTLPWSAISAAYQQMREAVLAIHPQVYFGAHWSHVYPEGACQYMTVRLPPGPDDAQLALHEKAWDVLEQLCIAHSGSISHHHGVGVFRGRWMAQEHGVGLELLQALKDHLDPGALLNPGKLGLRCAGNAETSVGTPS